MSHESHKRSARDISVRCVIITCSDTRTAETDTSGLYIRTALEDAGHEIVEYHIIKDDPGQIRQLLSNFAADTIDAVLINGGTGISRRDVTFDVVSSMLEKTLPGFGEIFRVLSFEEIGAAAMLSRATAGIIGNIMVFSMPGSTNAVRLALDRIILPELKHLAWEMRRF